jgi:hypothetical protein
MVFVPEGQHDSSQARSAWNHEENSPVPEGRLNLRLVASIKNLVKKEELPNGMNSVSTTNISGTDENGAKLSKIWDGFRPEAEGG